MDGHGTRVRWSKIGEYCEGELAGISILSHPKTVRIHTDKPFVNYAPVQLGDMSIEPGSPCVVQCWYITYDGEPNTDFIDIIGVDYAYPVGVTVNKQ